MAVVGYPSSSKNPALTVGVWFVFLAVLILAVSLVAGAFIVAAPTAHAPVVTPVTVPDSHAAIVSRIDALESRVTSLEARVGRLGSRVGSDTGAK